MKSVLAFLLKSENAKEVVRFLRERGPRAHVVAPEWVRTRVLGKKAGSNGPNAASWSREVSGIRPDASNVVIVADDAAGERTVLSQPGFPNGVKAFGLFADVFPALLCSMNGMASGHPTDGLKRYAIVCVPRCGSRYLAAVLNNRGIGAPKEHLREPLARVVAEGGLGFAHAVEALERFGQNNRIFGTKLISTFLLHASHRSLAEVRENFAWMSERGYRFVRLKRPLNETVVSSYIAFQMGRWHVFETLDEGMRARLETLEFEDGAAWSEYIRFRAENIVIDTLEREFAMPHIAYSEIETDVDGVVSRLADSVGVHSIRLEAGSARVPIPIRKESDTYRIFGERLAALLARREDEIEPAAVRKLRSMAKLSQEEAESLFSASP